MKMGLPSRDGKLKAPCQDGTCRSSQQARLGSLLSLSSSSEWSSGRGEISHKSRLSTLQFPGPGPERTWELHPASASGAEMLAVRTVLGGPTTQTAAVSVCWQGRCGVVGVLWLMQTP